MSNRNWKLIFVLPALTFILICFAANRVSAQDSADVAISYKTAYPGSFADVEVKLKNPMPVCGFQFMITTSNPELIDFHTDSLRVDTIVVPVDTCTWEPDSLHGDTCFVDSLVAVPVRYCYIDTVGSLISKFGNVQCHGDTGDTSSPECNLITVVGFDFGDTIYPYPNYRTLFRFGVDLTCLPDSTTDRNVSFYIFPGVFNHLSSPQGELIPYRYHQGELTAWWGVPGDANADSIVNVGDVVYLVGFLYRGGIPPCIPEASDVNGDCIVNVGDVVYLVSYLYRGGNTPHSGCWYGFGKEEN
jgi:hypothetical protein